ncbi:serine/arginine repetitive matrix protein 4 isoform X1 [Austrofundulus limnaeus]|uniref:Serine/arginine repetitive matrix protein 4 isoform X1 n=1 Tax=Austrofundulus limnaeus TaxID=52670 RepID=A0A2I4BFT7_AUSLI|nr:PREDICTED: serine/arginine repetitive matrix protein 4 isoform X1 [Austrofundulus limnaeus]
MQPLQLGHTDPSGALGSQSSSSSLLKLGEKQLFEKFWKGTFKAVATPRPESVIVASITARRRVTDSETTTCQPLNTDDRKAVDTQADSPNRNGCIKGRKHHHRHRRARIHYFDDVFSARPKGKKKKRKSERKRKRKRSPSPSLSPLRKKKKKKKKSSKKSKRHRYTSKKSKHSSSSLKRKRKDERKHKKSSRTRSHRRRRHRRSESRCSSCRSFAEDRHHLQTSEAHQALRDLGETRSGLNHRDAKWRRATKSVCKMATKCRSILSGGSILPSKSGSELFKGGRSQELAYLAKGPRDYDSGNDTSSPPSSKTGVSRASAAENKKNLCQPLASLNKKQKCSYKDNSSDSGNSVSSYASSCKHSEEDSLSAIVFRGNCKSEQITLGCQVEVVRSSKKRSRSSRRRLKSHSSSSRSRSSGIFRHSGRRSRSPSLYSCSSSSRSLSDSSVVRRRGSVVSLSSRGSYSRHSADRLRDRKRPSSSREAGVKHKVSGKRRRRKSYTPMKKRRRDSPSHLEARRITSARKRPIPYFRPSPSSSSRSTSVSSWSSLFTRSRSRSRSRSYSSYRSYSRSSSWNSIFGSCSRSRSRSSPRKRRKARQ